MIDYYLNISELKTESRIQECYDYYLEKDQTFDEYYKEYDIISEVRTSCETDDKNIFFKNGNLLPIKTCFMKCCLLESIQRCIDELTTSEINDPLSQLNKDITDYKEDFEYYPDSIEMDIPDKLFAKEELRRHVISSEVGTIDDKCNSKFFELAPHQLLLKNLFSPNTQYRGILIFHGVGVGKTCSGISIAENFRDVYGEEENRIIILASQNIRIGWRKTIFDPKKGENQCTGDEYLVDEENKKTMNDRQAKKKIKKYYELHGYGAFANSVRKLLDSETKHISDPKEKFIGEIAVIKKTYSNRVLIVDEVHNIRSDESEAKSRDTIRYIEMVIKYSDNLRLVLLTANPMYNMSSEIVWIINMLLLNDKKRTLSDKDIFDSEGNIKNIDLLKDKCKGYISYLRGENPVSFPIRLYPNHDKDKLIKKPGLPKDVFGNDISEDKRLSFLELYSSSFVEKGKQYEIYTDEVSKYEGNQKLRIEDESLLLQLSNIVYPNESKEAKDCYGEEGLLNCMKKTNKTSFTEYSYQSSVKEKYGEFFRKDLIEQYSSKIHSILNIIENTEGIVFIYSNWIGSGVVPLVLALEQNGYGKYDKKKILKTSEKIEPISYEGKMISEYEDKTEFKQAKYMVIAGSNLTTRLEEELKVLAEDNSDGSRIKVVIGSSVAAEGLDFKNIRSIHVLEPWHNINKIEQVIGRGIRNCSHKELLAKERNVTVYLHTSLIPKTDKESVDMYLYRYSEFKAKQIGQVEILLKEVALDKYFFRDANYLSDKDIGKFKVEPAYRYSNGQTKTIMYKGGDQEYSRVCSFTKDCDYMKHDKPKSYKQNDDTFQMQYSQGLIDVYKKRIHNLFLKSVSYSLDEIIDGLSEYKEVYEDILFHSLKEMEIEKYTLHNCFGDKGYLTISDALYNFQPYFNNDKLLSPYYRLNKGDNRRVDYIIEPKKKRETDITTDKQNFNEEMIHKIKKKVLDYQFEGFEKKVLGYLNLDTDNFIKYSYIIDRLSFQDKLVIGYSVLVYLKEGDSDDPILNLFTECYQKLFIYFDGSAYGSDQQLRSAPYEYKDRYDSKDKDNLVGFFLFHNTNKKPFFYHYENREIEIFNKVDEIDLVQMIKKNKNHKSLSFSDSWGFTTYADRHKYNKNGIVLKVIKKGDKLRKDYAYPPGPGVVIQDSGGLGSWIGETTLKFIKEEFSSDLARLSERDKEEFISSHTGAKKEYVFFIELCLRMNHSLIQSDLIYMKYY